MNFIGKTADGAVVMNRNESHLHEEISPIIHDVLLRVHTHARPFIEAEVDFGRVIGTSCCVSTGPGDQIIFAQRPNRKGLTRFVQNRESEPSSRAMIVLKNTGRPKEYVLITAFIGSKAEVEPWDQRATPASFQFWRTKALVWGEPIIEGTATTKCPWASLEVAGAQANLLPDQGTRISEQMDKHSPESEIIGEQELALRLKLDLKVIKKAIKSGQLRQGQHYFTIGGKPRFLWCPGLITNLINH